MKIVIIGTFPPFRGGLAHFNTAMYDELSKNHEVSAINFRTQYPSFLFPGETQFEENTPPDSGFQNRRLSSINPLTWFRVGQFVGGETPDLVIMKFWMPFFAPAFGVIARIIKKISSSTTILVVLDNVLPHEQRFWDVPVTKFFLKSVDKFVSMSRSVERDLFKLKPVARNIFLAHPVYDIFGEGLNRSAAKEKLNIDPNTCLILYFGFIRTYKGIDWLIKAAQLVKKQTDQLFKILIVGESYIDTDKYFKLLSEFDVEDVVDLVIKFVPDNEVGVYFSAADTVVLPYKSATQSGIAQIAYHFNRSLIVTDVGGLSEIVPQHEAGIVVQPGIDEIAKGILRFLQMEDTKQMEDFIGQYKEKFSWEYFCHKMIKFSEK